VPFAYSAFAQCVRDYLTELMMPLCKAARHLRSHLPSTVANRRRRRRRVASLAAVGVFLGVALMRVAAAQVTIDPGLSDRLLVHAGSESGLAKVDVHAGQGSVVLAGGRAGQPLVTVRLTVDAEEAASEARLAVARRAVASATLDSALLARSLYLQVRYSPASAATLVDEEWTITLPQAFDAEVEMASGKLFARDVAGHLDLRLGVGRIIVDTHGTGVTARVSYGDISVQALTDSPGELLARAGTGRAKVTLDGVALPARRPGPGTVVVAHDALGVHRFDLYTDRGNVELDVRRSAPADPDD
jgi:hypothetical protein